MSMSSCLHCKVPGFTPTGRHLASSSSFLLRPQAISYGIVRDIKPYKDGSRRRGIVCRGLLPVDPWAPTIDSESIASQLFAASLFPYLGFLYYITKSKTAPNLTLFGFYFLLAFVGATSKFLSFSVIIACLSFIAFCCFPISEIW